MSRARQLVVPIIVSLLFAATIWGGVSNASDLASTEALGERAVALMGMAYGLVSFPALYGLWTRRSWFPAVVLVWSILLVATATSAAAVYGGGVVGALSAALGTIAVAAPITLWARRRTRTQSVQPSGNGTAPASGT